MLTFRSPGREGEKPTPSLDLLLPVAVIALAAVLRFWALDSRGLWYDEAYSVALARMPWPEMVAATALDYHPPLYYWLLGRWIDLVGDSEVAVRFLSALLGVLAVAVALRLGEEIGGRRAGLLAGLIMAISPYFLLYSQEARMYALLVATTTAAGLFAWRAARFEPARRWAVGYVLASVVALYAHNSAVIGLVGLNVAYFAVALASSLRRRRTEGTRALRALAPLGPWLGCQVAVLLLLAPWLPVVLEQTSRFGTPNEQMSLVDVLGMVGGEFALGEVPAAGTKWMASAAWLFALGGLMLPAWRARRGLAADRTFMAGLFSAAWLGVGLLLLAINVVGRRDFNGRHVFVLYPAFSLLVAICLVELGRQWRPLAAVGLVILVPVVMSVGAYYADPHDNRPDQYGPVRVIANLGRPGDVVVLDAPYLKDVFDYYRPAGLPAVGLPEAYPPDAATTQAVLTDLAARYRRVWLILWQEYYADPQGLVPKWLDETQAPFMREEYYGDVQLRGYEVRAPGDTSFGGAIKLEGVEVVDFKAGWETKVRLRWRCLAPPEKDYQVFVHLLDGAGRFYGQHDGSPNGGLSPTSGWQAGDLIQDEHIIRIPADAAGMELELRAGLYSLEDGRRLTSSAGDNLVLMRTKVERGDGK